MPNNRQIHPVPGRASISKRAPFRRNTDELTVDPDEKSLRQRRAPIMASSTTGQRRTTGPQQMAKPRRSIGGRLLRWSWRTGTLQYMVAFGLFAAFFGNMVYLAWNQGVHEYKASQNLLNAQVLDWGTGKHEVITGVDATGHGFIITIKQSNQQLQASDTTVYVLPEVLPARSWIDVEVHHDGARTFLSVQPFGRVAHGLWLQANGKLVWDKEG